MRTPIIAMIFLISLPFAPVQPPITFCDLLRNPSKYDGQHVRVRATLRYGFEWKQLFCMDCLDKGQAWLDTTQLDDESSSHIFHKLPDAGIVNLTVEGTFRTDGTFGHNNGYRYQITADKIENVKVLLKGNKSREAEEKIEKKSACGGTQPKIARRFKAAFAHGPLFQRKLAASDFS